MVIRTESGSQNFVRSPEPARLGGGGSKARAVFMGTPAFAVPSLEALVTAGYRVVGVYTQPDRPAGRGRMIAPSEVKAAALDHGIPVFQPDRLGRAAAAELAGLEPEVIVVAAYGLLLPRPVLAIPSKGAINVHPSLLPRHRGASPIAGAILAGDTETGVSIMLMDAGLDTGPVLAQEHLSIASGDTTGTLAARLALLSADLLVRTLDGWLQGAIVPQPQDSASATTTPLITKDDGALDWGRTAVELTRQVRAFQPWPGAFTHWNGQVLKILDAVPLPGKFGKAGQVVPLTEQGSPLPGQSMTPLGVQTAGGVLGLLRLQLEGRRAVTAAEFFRGARAFAGSSLGSAAVKD